MTYFVAIVLVVLVAPFLAYFVAKFAAMGYFMGKRCFDQFQKENHNGKSEEP